MIRRLVAALIAIMLLCGTALAEYKELSVGSKDTSEDWAVYSLQLKLIQLDYLDGIADGMYGNGTAAAVKAFQQDNGLEVTGIADVETQELLFTMEEKDAAADPDATPEPDEEVLEAGDVNNDVFIVQNNLYIWGFLTTEPDGIFGPGTKQALADFQKYTLQDMLAYSEAQLNPDGTVEPTPEPTPEPTDGMYIMEMVEDEKLMTDGTLTASWLDYILNGFVSDIVEVRENDKNDDVKRVQTRLVGLGYMAAGNDGVFGEHSKVALKYFQRLNGLEETGWVDETTEAKLFSGSALMSDKYVSMYKAMVSVEDQRVYIYQWTGEDYTALVHTFICSTGAKETPTILGTYQAPGRNGEWYWMEDSEVWVKYAFVIDGGYFFHSVLYPTKEGGPTKTSMQNLGKRVSHGCIRLSAEDAEWIYDNCASGMTVTIYED
ncbi:MAG: murein L,D-transpeptidase [Clostridia bacterium]|nr:murein L,D-transpeptidase [Clostridia bacterium]